MSFNSVKNCTLKKFAQIHNKICILRSYGGLGDIVAMRMIFEDLKLKYPDFHVTWALPNRYFAVAKNHPYIDEVINYYDFKRENFIEVYNLSTACSNYEWKLGKNNDKNRADIWAEHFGLKLENHNIYLPSYPENFESVSQKLKHMGWDGKKKLCCLAPRSAINIKNMTEEQVRIIQQMTCDMFLFILHELPILEFTHLNIPTLSNLSLKDAMVAVEISTCVIATDTGILHVAAAYNKPTLGLFSFVDGYVYCKYYNSVQIVQKHWKTDENWCGPCYDHGRCPVTKDLTKKPCMTSIDEEMLKKNWSIMLNKYSIY